MVAQEAMLVRPQRLRDQIRDLDDERFWAHSNTIASPRRVKMSPKSSAPPIQVPAEKLGDAVRRARLDSRCSWAGNSARAASSDEVKALR